MTRGFMTTNVQTRRHRPASLAIAALVGASCAGHTTAPATQEKVDPVEVALRALGTADALAAVRYLEIAAEGQRLEPGQSHAPGQEAMDMPVSEYRYRATEDRSGDRFRMEWNRTVRYPYPVTLDYAVIVDEHRGVVDGKDGVFSAPRATMLPANVATLRKLRWLTSPDLLLLRGRTQPGAVQARPDEDYLGRKHHVVAVTVDDSALPVRLFIDARTALPTKVDTLEDDPIFGDALVEVELGDWRREAGILWPHKLTHKVAGHPVQTETRSVRVGVVPSSDAFGVPRTEAREPDATAIALGARSSQWFLRMHAYGIPHYDRHLPVTMTEVAPGVVHVAGGTHHSLVVEMEDHLVVIEAPLYEERTDAVLASLARRWPGKPARVVVATHFHDDHVGGLRAYAAAGATIVTSATSRKAVDEYLRAPHTVFPDTLQRHPREVAVEVVRDKLVLGMGARAVEIRAIPSSHAKDMLVAYLPAQRFLLVSDIYSPGAIPEPFKVFARELLAFIDRSGLVVERLGGTHGGIGTVQELRAVLSK
jgi:glyoxylase-like metal-dependent hydrolase (beta-lactamase superfamily II)